MFFIESFRLVFVLDTDVCGFKPLRLKGRSPNRGPVLTVPLLPQTMGSLADYNKQMALNLRNLETWKQAI